MSIRDDMIQKVLGNPGKYSIQQLEAAMKSGSLPAYVVVPIIQDKVQQQKQMQAAMMMQQQPVQQMPPIAEQIMQEAQGVTQLPSNMPEEYAGGGIVAFDEGGLSFAGMKVLETEEQRRAREAYEEARRRIPFEDEIEARRLRNLEEQKQKPGIEALAAAAQAAPVTNISASEIAVPGMGGYETPPTTARRMLSDEETQQIINQMRAKGIPVGLDTYKDIKSGRVPAGISAAPTALPTEATRPDVAPRTISDFQPVGEAAAPGGGGITGITGFMNELKALQQQEGIAPTTQKRFEEFAPGFRKTVQGIEERRKTEAEKLRGQVTGQAYEGLEASLRKEAEQAGVDKEQAKHMAIFKAGLAMLAGTSPNAIENIGKGALVGAEDYQRAAADIKKAQKENQRMMAHIEQARRAEKRGDVERQLDELDKAASRELKVEEFLSKGLFEAGIKDEETHRALFKDRATIAGHLGVAQIQGKSREDLAALRAELAGPRGALTEYQKRTLLSRERDKFPIEKARMELAKMKKWDKIPKIGENTKFDEEVQRYWETKIHTLAGLPYDSGATSQTQKQPMDPRYRVLGQSQ